MSLYEPNPESAAALVQKNSRNKTRWCSQCWWNRCWARAFFDHQHIIISHKRVLVIASSIAMSAKHHSKPPTKMHAPRMLKPVHYIKLSILLRKFEQTKAEQQSLHKLTKSVIQGKKLRRIDLTLRSLVMSIVLLECESNAFKAELL